VEEHNRQRKFELFGLLIAALALCLGMLATSPVWAQAAAPTSQVSVVMSGLDNPRGLAFGPEGALYVAEAGRGPSDDSCFTNPEQPQCKTETLEGETVFGCGCSTPNTPVEDCAQSKGMLVCSGPTGTVSRWWNGRQEQIVTGLPSWATPAGRAEGPNGVSILGLGEAAVTIGLEASPRLIADMRSVLGKDFGKLAQFSGLSGEWRFVSDLAAYEEANSTRDPSNGTPDSNPFGLLLEQGERVVVDSGGNALLRVAADGEISTLAVLPSLPRPSCQTCTDGVKDGDPVPTGIALGPDGAYYVGILTGAPFPDGFANIYRLVPSQSPQVVCTGFKAIIGVAFDAAGNLYVLQHSTGPTGLTADGALFRIDAETLLQNGCSRANSSQVQTGDARLIRPTAVAVGPDGALYVSNHGTFVGTGEVLRIVP
jgi:sugar lactone lactonase YvrE